jgi:hypothetical protein
MIAGLLLGSQYPACAAAAPALVAAAARAIL